MLTINVAVIGCGRVAERRHLPGFQEVPGARLVAVCDVDPERAGEMARRFGVPEVYTDLETLLDHSPVEAVSICTPNALHAPQALAALEAGMHVLVEKPMAVSLAQADSMIASASRSGRILMIEQPLRFDPAAQAARSWLASGRLGRPLTVRATHAHGGPRGWAPGTDWFFRRELAGAGVLADLGIHKIDLLRWLLDDEVEEVAAQTARFGGRGEVEDSAVCLLRFRRGTLATLLTSWKRVPGRDFSLSIFCEGGCLHLHTDPAHPLIVEEAGAERPLYPAVPAAGEYGTPFQYFVRCIREGASPFIDAQEGRASLEVVLAALEAAETGRTVRLPQRALAPAGAAPAGGAIPLARQETGGRTRR